MFQKTFSTSQLIFLYISFHSLEYNLSSFSLKIFFKFLAICIYFFFQSSSVVKYNLASNLSISSAWSKSLDIFLSNHSKSLFLFFDAFA